MYLCVCIYRECFPDLCCSDSRPLSPPRDSRCSGVKLRIKNRFVCLSVLVRNPAYLYLCLAICISIHEVILLSSGNRTLFCCVPRVTGNEHVPYRKRKCRDGFGFMVPCCSRKGDHQFIPSPLTQVFHYYLNF